MKYWLAPAVLMLGVWPEATAQKYEYGVFLGGSNYFGELAPKIVMKESHAAYGLFYRNNYSPFFSLKTGFYYGSISGSDQNFEFNKPRNLSFRSDIIEASSQLEFNFRPFGLEMFAKNFSSYVFAGFAVFYHQPQAFYNGQWVNLRPLGTEGQLLRHSATYSDVAVALPFGGGFKWNISKHWAGSFELGFRRTTTDYLDDVSRSYPNLDHLRKYNNINPQDLNTAVALSDRSGEISKEGNLTSEGDQRGNPRNKDWYIMGGITLSYRIVTNRCHSGKLF